MGGHAMSVRCIALSKQHNFGGISPRKETVNSLVHCPLSKHATKNWWFRIRLDETAFVNTYSLCLHPHHWKRAALSLIIQNYFRIIISPGSYLISFDSPNFHSTSDWACKTILVSPWGKVGKDLYPLVGVRHHRNQEVDQDDGGDQHVKGKDYLEEIHQAGRVVWRHVQFVVAGKRGNVSVGEVSAPLYLLLDKNLLAEAK